MDDPAGHADSVSGANLPVRLVEAMATVAAYNEVSRFLMALAI
ncbi:MULTISPECIES: hypothetical protein [Burkholderia]|nr:hypothetical protein [Burkholderia sp. lyk4-R2A-23]